MSKIALIAKLTVAEANIERLLDAFDVLIDAAKEEDGLEIYSVHAHADNPRVFYFYELYRDQAAFDAHGQSERMKAAMAPIGVLLGKPPEVTMLNPVTAKGIRF